MNQQQTITYNNHEYAILSRGIVNAQGETYMHLASTTDYTTYKNGRYPRQMAAWIKE